MTIHVYRRSSGLAECIATLEWDGEHLEGTADIGDRLYWAIEEGLLSGKRGDTIDDYEWTCDD